MHRKKNANVPNLLHIGNDLAPSLSEGNQEPDHLAFNLKLHRLLTFQVEKQNKTN
jgi:hypothetical protein